MKLRRDKVLDNFRAMIRIKTVSSGEGKASPEEFARFRELLRERYPAVFSAGESWQIGEYGLLIRIPGVSAERPVVLMAHMDVVPAEGKGWESDPFSGEIKGGRVWGRGTLDTKCTLCAILEAVTYHLENGRVPSRDLYLSFGGEEEISGPCCGEIVRFLEERGVRPGFVLDEGGSLIPEGLPGVKGLCAVIGIAEKGTAEYRVRLSGGKSGHASVPPRSTTIGKMARAAIAIESHPFPKRLSSPVVRMFHTLAPYVPIWMKPIYAHVEWFSPLICSAAPFLGDTFNAMVRSTTALTMCEGGTAGNVLPEGAELRVNVRLLEGDTPETAERRLRRVIRDPAAEVTLLSGTNPTAVSDTGCRAYRILEDTIRETWPEAVTVPYQMNGGTDSRFYTEITNHVYRFSPMIMTKDERSRVHGKNESIGTETLFRMITFYIRLIGRL